jgi:hypothetical protein
MSFTHTSTYVYADDAGTVATATDTKTADEVNNWDGSIAANTTNQALHLAFTTASVVSLLLSAPGTQGVTLKTNSSSSPVDTITLAAGQSIIWTTSRREAIPFTADVTEIYATNASTTVAAPLKIRVLRN